MVVLAATAVAGCSTRSLVTPDGRAIFRSSRLGTTEQVKEVRYRTKDGAEFTLRGYSSDQVEALAAVTEAAVRAAISSQNPSGAGFNLGQFVVPAGMKAIQRGRSVVLVPTDDPSQPTPEIEP